MLNGSGLCVHLSFVCFQNRLNVKILSYQYKDPHVNDKMFSRPSYI